jgi:hypothetical protein
MLVVRPACSPAACPDLMAKDAEAEQDLQTIDGA